MNVYTLDNPVFADFLFYVMVLMLKMFVVQASVGIYRMSNRVRV